MDKVIWTDSNMFAGQTLSIGFLAPTHGELLTAYVADASAQDEAAQRFQDPKPAVRTMSGLHVRHNGNAPCTTPVLAFVNYFERALGPSNWKCLTWPQCLTIL